MSALINRRVLFNLFKQIKNSPYYNNNTNTKCLNMFTGRIPQKYILTVNLPNLETYRTKSKASKRKEKAAVEESDEEEVEDVTETFDDLIVDKYTKVLTVKVNSLRADVILKNGLTMARNKVEEAFYESKIRVNGKKILKKSESVNEGDELDIIRGASVNNPNFLTVGRVEVLEVKARSEGYAVKLRRCKNLMIENYEEPWKPGD